MPSAFKAVPQPYRWHLFDLRDQPHNHQGELGTLVMMLDITEHIRSANPLRHRLQSAPANAQVRGKPNRKWARRWAQKLFPGIYPMKTTDVGGAGVCPTTVPSDSATFR
jgi:hypothetical protein